MALGKRKFGNASFGSNKRRRRTRGRFRRRRRRRFAFRGRRSKRNILQITSEKKRDTMLSSSDSDPTLNTPSSVIYGGTTMMLFCPTFRQKYDVAADTNIPDNKTIREQSKVYFKGYREESLLRIVKPLLWRRIVYWSFRRDEQAIPYRYDTASRFEYYTRRTTFVAPSASDYSNWFQGTNGVDYHQYNLIFAKFNNNRNKVVYDKTKVMNPGVNWSGYAGTNGFTDTGLHPVKWWFKGGYIQYDDKERGSEVATNDRNGWSALDPVSKGNMYILDIFSQGWDNDTVGTNDEVGTISNQGVAYWHEK